MCFGTTPQRPPEPPPLPPAMKAPDPPPSPAPAPRPLQLEGSRPDLRIGGQKKMAGSSQRNRVSANSLRGTLNIGGNSGGLNS